MENIETDNFQIKNNKLWLLGVIIIVILGAGFIYKSKNSNKHPSAPPARPVDISDISARAENIPPPINSTRVKGENKTVSIDLHATQIVAELADGTTYEYWTYNNQVPGPFIRVKEGDTVAIKLTHDHAHNKDAHMMLEKQERFFTINSLVSAASAHEEDEHMTNETEMAQRIVEGHTEHSIDLHAVLGPGGGAEFTRVGPNETKMFEFKALRPGLYIYHCASPHVPSHIANGMYGLILVESKEGLSPVDKEFYVVQGELYTTGKIGEKGHQELDKEKLLNEKPEYFVFNGRPKALTGSHALHAKVGEKIRIFFGVSGQLVSNFHIIGEVFDKVYPEGDIISSPHKNVQTTLVPGGGAVMVEFTPEVPGKYLLVDHALTRAIDRGALGELIIEGPERPEIIKKVR